MFKKEIGCGYEAFQSIFAVYQGNYYCFVLAACVTYKGTMGQNKEIGCGYEAFQ